MHRPHFLLTRYLDSIEAELGGLDDVAVMRKLSGAVVDAKKESAKWKSAVGVRLAGAISGTQSVTDHVCLFASDYRVSPE